MESTKTRVSPGYLVVGGTRMPETHVVWSKPCIGQESLANRPSVVGGVQQAAVLVMSTHKSVFRTIDAVTGIPPSAQGRT